MMHLQQRHVATIDLRDGQAWSFHCEDDSAGWRLSALGDLDVLYVELPESAAESLARELVRHNVAWPTDGHGRAPWRPAWQFGAAWIDRKNVIKVNLRQPQALETCLQAEGEDWRLSFVRADVAVHLLLTTHHVRLLRRLVAPPATEVRLDRQPVAAIPVEFLTPRLQPLDWLAYN